jgi:hypothetical protein
VLSTRAVDRRTRIGKALQAWRTELIDDLGGIENLSAAKIALIDSAVKTKLILDSIEVWILRQPSLVSGRNRGVLPVVLHRNALVGTLRQILADLGLERRRREVLPLGDYLADRARAGAAGTRPGAASPPAAPLSTMGESERERTAQ